MFGWHCRKSASALVPAFCAAAMIKSNFSIGGWLVLRSTGTSPVSGEHLRDDDARSQGVGTRLGRALVTKTRKRSNPRNMLDQRLCSCELGFGEARNSNRKNEVCANR